MTGTAIKVAPGILRTLVEKSLDSHSEEEVVKNVLPLCEEHLGGQDLKAVCRVLQTDANTGIMEKESMSFEERRAMFGPNRMPEVAAKTLFELMFEAAQDPTVVILCCSAVLSLGLGLGFECRTTGWIEGFVIIMAVVIVIMVSAVNDYQKEKQFRALNAIKNDVQVNVVRNGKQIVVSTFDIVVGDVVDLAVGDMLCADGIFLYGNDLQVNEASLTGESDDLKKGHYVFHGGKVQRGPFLIGSTKVMEGSGRMVVVAVGTNSFMGSTRQLLAAEEEEEGALTIKLDHMAQSIGKLALYIGILVLGVLLIRFAVDFGIKETGYERWENSRHWKELLGFIIISVTVLVVAVPEGLPLAVVIALAFSVKKMLQDNNLVRHLPACETMGGATTICSDKTGTLTMNRMTVMKCWAAEKIVEANGAGLLPSVQKMLADAMSLNSSARLEFPVSGPPEHIGNKTECGMLQFVHAMGMNYEEIRKARGDVMPKIFTFSSARKRMTTQWDWGDGNIMVFTKGASEIILDLCTNVLDDSGNPIPLTAVVKNRLKDEVIRTFAEDSLRTICVASRTISKSAGINHENPDEVERDLTCLCIVGIEDPVRPEVPAALQDCMMAGITVRMVTGDNLVTATAISRKCGIAAQLPDFIAMEGPVFRERVFDAEGNVLQGEIDKIWPKLLVLARSSPKDKHTLVSGIMASRATEMRQVVAVTGDGTNDGPALKKADIGFAMGITGTSVAKDAADIILMDDNFTSIVKAVKWGRCVYDNICKFLQFQLTVNIAAVIVAVFGACILMQSPLRAIHLLWINLIMDSLASLALATEKPVDALLHRKPYGRSTPLISPTMWRNMLLHAAFQIAISLWLIWGGENVFTGSESFPSGRPVSVHVGPADDPCKDHSQDPSVHYTIVFNVFVLMQLFNEINSRRINNEANVFEHIFDTPYFAIVVGVTMVLQVILVEFGDQAFKTTTLSGPQWAFCLGIGLFELVWYQIIRFIPPSLFKGISNFVGGLGWAGNKIVPEDEPSEGIELQHKDASADTVVPIGPGSLAS